MGVQMAWVGANTEDCGICMHSGRERAHGLDGDEDGVEWNGMLWACLSWE